MYKEIYNYKILKLFFNRPNSVMYIREIARLIGLHPNTVLKDVKILVKENILIQNKKKIITELQANLESSKYVFYKRLYNIESIFDSDLLGYLIDKYNSPDTIVLYGSYSLGEDNEKGDIDIAVITKRRLNLDYSRFEKRLKRNVHIVEIKENINKGLKNNIRNGVILYGRLSI